MSFWASLRCLLRSRAYLALVAAATLMGLNVFASAVWTPTFLMRVHGLTLGEVAATVGPIRGFCGLAGVLLGGWIIDRLGRRARHWRMTIAAIACFLVAPAEMIYALGDTRTAWLGAYAVGGFLLLIHQGPVFAAVVAVAGPRRRAVATSILLFCSALFGQAVGPLAVGISNDLLEPRFGVEAIRYSMLLIAATAALAGISLLYAGRSIRSNMESIA